MDELDLLIGVLVREDTNKFVFKMSMTNTNFGACIYRLSQFAKDNRFDVTVEKTALSASFIVDDEKLPAFLEKFNKKE